MILFFILIFALLVGGLVWERRYRRKRRLALLQQLRAWAGQALVLDPPLLAWVQKLSEEEANILLELLTGYCASLNWELTWLFAPQIDKAPVLKQALETHVVAYAQAILSSLQMEEDVRAYQAYLAFASKPTARKQRMLAEKLYPRLCGAGLISAATTKPRWFFRRKAMRNQQIGAIQQAFEQQPEQTMTLLQQLLQDDTTAALQQHKSRTPISSTQMTIPLSA